MPSDASVDGGAPTHASCAIDQRFGRDARLLSPTEFGRCLQRPPTVRSGSFALHVAVGPDDAGTPRWRLGLVIPKRFEASAVARNTIKRRWRDAFRRSRAAWAVEFGSVDIVVRLTAPLVPKPAKRRAARRGDGSPAGPADAGPPVMPAKTRARTRFDPATILTTLAAKLRSRRGAPPGEASPGSVPAPSYAPPIPSSAA